MGWGQVPAEATQASCHQDWISAGRSAVRPRGQAAAEPDLQPQRGERSCPSSPSDRSVGRAVAPKHRVNDRFFPQPCHDSRSLSLRQRRGAAEGPGPRLPTGFCQAEGNISPQHSATVMETGHAGASQGGLSLHALLPAAEGSGREVPHLLPALRTETAAPSASGQNHDPDP